MRAPRLFELPELKLERTRADRPARLPADAEGSGVPDNRGSCGCWAVGESREAVQLWIAPVTARASYYKVRLHRVAPHEAGAKVNTASAVYAMVYAFG